MKSKTNRRVKRISRGNRRSRRTQRGGVKGRERAKLRTECELQCKRQYPYNEELYINDTHTTDNGWYLYSYGTHVWDDTIGVKHKTFSHDREHYLSHTYTSYVEELPDPTKIYTTSSFLSRNKKNWRLKYNHKDHSLEWENQEDKTIKPFVIQSPLNIGDQMAKQIT
jgi:hypothetical protein